MHLTGYLTVLRRWWWSLLIATWAAGLAGYVVASSLTPTYEAAARVLVGPVNADIDTVRAASLLAGTYSELVASEPVVQSAVNDIGLTEPPIDVRSTADETTRLITIRVQYSDAATSAALANALADELIQLSRQGTVRPEGEVRTIEPAVAPLEPIAPRVGLITGLTAVAGLVGALLLVLVLDLFDDRLKEVEELDEVGVPLIGRIPSHRPPTGDADRPLVVDAAPEGRAAAGYQQLAGRISMLAESLSLKRLAIVGIDPGDHVGEVAANVTVLLGRIGFKVTLVDANGSEREIDRLLQLAPRFGVSDAVASPTGHQEQASVTRGGQSIVPYGTAGHPVIVDAKVADRLLSAWHGSSQLTIIATAAPHLDASVWVWANAADATLLVLRREHTKRAHLRNAIEGLQLAGAKIVGAAMHDGDSGPRAAASAVPTPTRTVPVGTTQRRGGKDRSSRR